MTVDERVLDLAPAHATIVRAILADHLPYRTVLAFGSRARSAAKRYSDLDLVVMGDEPLPLAEMAALAEAFDMSDLPFKVDVVSWETMDERFRALVLRDGVPVHRPVAVDT